MNRRNHKHKSQFAKHTFLSDSWILMTVSCLLWAAAFLQFPNWENRLLLCLMPLFFWESSVRKWNSPGTSAACTYTLVPPNSNTLPMSRSSLDNRRNGYNTSQHVEARYNSEIKATQWKARNRERTAKERTKVKQRKKERNKIRHSASRLQEAASRRA